VLERPKDRERAVVVAPSNERETVSVGKAREARLEEELSGVGRRLEQVVLELDRVATVASTPTRQGVMQQG
jgi:hypothetical protein